MRATATATVSSVQPALPPGPGLHAAALEAERCRVILASQPGNAALQCQLAGILCQLEQYEEAGTAYLAAIALDPSATTLCAYAAMLSTLQRHAQAIETCRMALLQEPDNGSIYNSLGMALQAAGHLDEALQTYRDMLARMPGNAVAHNNIASVLQAKGQLDAAMEHYRQALASAPYFDFAHFNAGTCLMRLERPEQALHSFTEAIRLNPNLHLAQINLTAMQSKLGRLDDTIATCRRALALHPEWADMHSNLLFTLSHSAGASAAMLLDEHRRFGQQFELPWRPSWPRHANDRAPQRRLRVGFVSGDWNNHALANFIAPILDHLMHASGLELVIYSNNYLDDAVTAQLRRVVDQWHDIQALPDAALVQKIRDDGIDILIDLSGHTGYNRLPALARKPAPLQLSWMGYPLTTGLGAVDYYLTDRHFSPPGLLDDQFTEKLLYLPATAPFMPSPDAPAISAAPAAELGHITFGSFNRPNKLGPAVIARWARLLNAVPTAHMVFGGMASEQNSTMLREAFARHGIAAARLQFFLQTNTRDYLGLHRLVDVCLDTLPYAGGTTTFHALWMGVPTLTMTGATQPGMAGASIMGHAGLPEFIAHDEAGFLKKGIALASQLDYLAELRTDMRARISNSALGQPALIAAGLDNALRTIWQRWCAGLPATSFDADPAQSSLSLRASSMQSLHDVNVEAALLLAIDHHQASRYTEAETLYLAILHRQPQHGIANHNMGLLARQLGFQDEALPYLAAAHAAAPDEAQFCLSYAQCLLQMGQARPAHAALAAAMADGMDDAQVHALLLRAEAACAEPAAQPSQEEAEHIVALYQAGELAQLEGAARALVSHYPDSGFAWSVLGTSLQAQGKEALATLQRAVQLAPDDAQAHGNLGNAWLDAAQHAAAMASYRCALALEPDFSAAWSGMGCAQQALGRYAEAAESFRQALAIDPQDAMAQRNLESLMPAAAAIFAGSENN